MKTKKLIINADDFGFTYGVSQAIAQAMKHSVTSTTVMGNGVDLPRHLELLQDVSHRGIGVHLVLSAGRPVLPPEQVPSLVNQDGAFNRNFRQATRRANPAEVYKEWRAQIEMIMRCGVKPTHVDSHHHVHLAPKLTALTIQLAQEFGIPAIRRLTVMDVYREEVFWKNAVLLPMVARSACLIEKSGLGFPDRLMSLNASNIHALKALPPGIYELFCHPGVVDSELAAKSSLLKEREDDLRLLTASAFADYLQDNGIELVDYSALGGR